VDWEAFQVGVDEAGGVDIFADELLNLRNSDVVWDLRRASVSSFVLSVSKMREARVGGNDWGVKVLSMLLPSRTENKLSHFGGHHQNGKLM
jgi:hypothetical protein